MVALEPGRRKRSGEAEESVGKGEESDAAVAEMEAAAQRKMVPVPPAAAMMEVVGSTQPERSTALLSAAAGGDLLRLRAALLAGCDLEATDECGQTAACTFTTCELTRVDCSCFSLVFPSADCFVMHGCVVLTHSFVVHRPCCVARACIGPAGALSGELLGSWYDDFSVSDRSVRFWTHSLSSLTQHGTAATLGGRRAQQYAEV